MVKLWVLLPEHHAMKIIVIILIGLILLSLFTALFAMLKPRADQDPARMVKALSIRVGLSLLLFILLMIAYKLGWIAPHPV